MPSSSPALPASPAVEETFPKSSHIKTGAYSSTSSARAATNNDSKISSAKPQMRHMPNMEDTPLSTNEAANCRRRPNFMQAFNDAPPLQETQLKASRSF